MKPIAREWIAKAEADFATAERELAVQVGRKLRRRVFPCATMCRKIFKSTLTGT